MSNERLHRLCAKSDVGENGILAVHAPGYEPLAVCHVNGKFYVIADTCTHGLASLSEGEIMDAQVYCPFHGGAFDVATGEPTVPPCTVPIATYPVIERGDELFIAAREEG